MSLGVQLHLSQVVHLGQLELGLIGTAEYLLLLFEFDQMFAQSTAQLDIGQLFRCFIVAHLRVEELGQQNARFDDLRLEPGPKKQLQKQL